MMSRAEDGNEFQSEGKAGFSPVTAHRLADRTRPEREGANAEPAAERGLPPEVPR